MSNLTIALIYLAFDLFRHASPITISISLLFLIFALKRHHA